MINTLTLVKKHTKTHTRETKPEPSGPSSPTVYKNCSYECAYNCVQLQYTIQHRTVQIIFPLIIQTINIGS